MTNEVLPGPVPRLVLYGIFMTFMGKELRRNMAKFADAGQSSEDY